MSDGIVFVLHVAADEKQAAELAQALAPLPVFPALLFAPGSGGVEYGVGAVCVVLWTDAALGAAADVLSAISHGAQNAVIVRIGGAPLPDELAGAAFTIVESQGEPAADATRLREEIARIGRGRVERGARPGRRRASLGSPALLHEAPLSASKSRKLPVRSAVGLAATLAVVGVVAPTIGPRGATSAESSHGDTSAEQAPPEAVPTHPATDVEFAASELPAPVEAPAVEHAALDTPETSALAQFLLRPEPSPAERLDAAQEGVAAAATPEAMPTSDSGGVVLAAAAEEAPGVADTNALDGAALEGLSAAKGARPPAASDSAAAEVKGEAAKSALS